MLIHTVDEQLAAAAPWGEVGGEPEAGTECGAPSLPGWVEETVRLGVNLHGSRLRPPTDATTVRVRDGKLLLTDGPFVETKEQVAGYDLLECANMDEAVAWAAKHPTAVIGAVEVRPLWGAPPPAGLPEPAQGRRRYMMLVCTDPTLDRDQIGPTAPVGPWVDEMDARGVRRLGSQLDEPARARTVRVRDAGVLVTDGPFAETREQIAGFDILDCTDLDDAIEIARAHPMATHGILEVRPFWPFREQ